MTKEPTAYEIAEAATLADFRQYVREASALMGAARAILDVMAIRHPTANPTLDHEVLRGMMVEINDLLDSISAVSEADNPLLDDDLQAQLNDGLISRKEAAKMQIERAKLKERS
jgi:hypothetical protein